MVCWAIATGSWAVYPSIWLSRGNIERRVDTNHIELAEVPKSSHGRVMVSYGLKWVLAEIGIVYGIRKKAQSKLVLD